MNIWREMKFERGTLRSNEHLRNQDLGRNEHSEADLNLKFFFETKQKVDEFFHIQM